MASSQSEPDLILLDFCLPQMTGLELVEIFRRRFPQIPIVMLAGERDPDTIIETMKAGANDDVIKGSEDFESNLKFRISQALERLRLQRKNRELEVENISHIEKNRELAEKVASLRQGTSGVHSHAVRLAGDRAGDAGEPSAFSPRAASFRDQGCHASVVLRGSNRAARRHGLTWIDLAI